MNDYDPRDRGDYGFGYGRGDNEGMGLRGKRGKRRLPGMENGELVFDYKNTQLLRNFLTDRGKIVPRRISGLSAKQQRQLTLAVRRARNIALLPYTSSR